MSTVTLADVKTYMNITTTTNDAELQLFLDAAEKSIINKCGPLVSTPVTKRARGGKTVLTVPVTPVLTLTSVTPVNGTALDITKLNADPAGVIEYLAGGTFASVFHDVVYTAGRSAAPVDLVHAVKEHTRHLWESQQGGTRRPGQAGAPAVPAAAYAFTWKVNELIGPYLQGGLG